MKWFCAAAAVATALSLYPFLAGESIGLDWAWYVVGFEATVEQETEILPEQLEEIGRRMGPPAGYACRTDTLCVCVQRGNIYCQS